MKNWFDNRRKQTIAVFLLVLAGIIYSSLRSPPGSPKAVVEQAVKEMVEGAENRELGPFKKHFSEEIRDEQGRNKTQMLAILRGIFFRYKTISLSVVSLEAERGTNPDTYYADLTLLMGDSLIPTDKGQFRLTFRREGNKWRVWEADWGDGAAYGAGF